jgi:hypothetical protein
MTKMTFKTLTGALAVAATLTISATAHAATVLTWTTANVGVTNSLDFNGFSDGDVIDGLTANIDYKLTSVGNSGKSWVFSYNVENTSDWPTIWASRISGFGFNVDPNISTTSATGEFTKTSTGNVPEIGSREVCITNVNCAGGGNGGVDLGDTGVGTFTLNFSQAKTSVSLSDFYVRYQSVYGGDEWGGSAVGTALTSNTGTPAVPEPATWAMMLIGFFAIGSTLRSRRPILA